MQKKNAFWINNSKKIWITILISMIWVSTVTPIVLAGNTTQVYVSFLPTGNVNIDVVPKIWNCSTVTSGWWKNSSGTAFTLWNNGTTSMKTKLKTNTTTDPAGAGPMTYDTAWLPVPNQQYSFNTSGFTQDWCIPTGYTGPYVQTINAASNVQFGLKLKLGYLSSNVSWQKTTIYFQGTAV